MRVSQPLWSTSAHAVPNCDREYPVFGARPLMASAARTVVAGTSPEVDVEDARDSSVEEDDADAVPEACDSADEDSDSDADDDADVVGDETVAPASPDPPHAASGASIAADATTAATIRGIRSRRIRPDDADDRDDADFIECLRMTPRSLPSPDSVLLRNSHAPNNPFRLFFVWSRSAVHFEPSDSPITRRRSSCSATA